MEHSLLNYARFHHIASDYAAVDPLSYIDHTFKVRPGDDSLSQHIRSECETRLRNARATLDLRLRAEKLRVSKKIARYLTSVIRENQAESMEINWDELLPDPRRFAEVRIEPTILPLERETDVRLSKRPLRYRAGDVKLEQPDEIREAVNIQNPLVDLRKRGCSLLEQAKKDKLKVSKGCFSLIQSVRNNDGPSTEELEGILGRLLEGHCQREVEPTNPPEILPLSLECFSSSPAPIHDEKILPSPVSSAGLGLNLCRRQTTSCEIRAESFMSDPVKTRQISSPTRARPQGHLPPTGDELLDLERSDEEDHGSRILDKTSDGFLPGVTSKESSLPVNETPIFVYDTKTTERTNVRAATNDKHTNKRARRASSGGAELAVRRDTVTKKRRQNNLDTTSNTEMQQDFLPSNATHDSCPPSSQPPTIHTAASNARQCTGGQVMPSQKPQCESLGSGHQAVPSQRRPDSQLRLKLGSLSSFLETRGKCLQSQMPAKSPYFATNTDGQPSNGTNMSVQQHQPKANTTTPKTTHTPLIPLVEAPRTLTNHKGLVLFTSTALLKTHPRVIQCLESSEHPPKLIYRDYAESPLTTSRQSKPQLQPHNHQIQTQTLPASLPPEADIILSPRTGIILTTSQATIQLYLPGHKPTLTEATLDAAKVNIKSINSPLRESIFRLSSRYEQLYTFITHNPDKLKRCKSQLDNPTFSADKHLLSSLNSLGAFCSSLSASAGQYQYASITPFLVPSTPESIADWILALAHKNVCTIPPSIPPPGFRYSIAFTPVNPKLQLAGLLGDCQESAWELFLRRAGLNPFAARVVLAVLRREDERHGVEMAIGSLSRFIELSPKERKGLFGSLLGDKILRRLESLIERDWQCDWALRFDDEIE